jgi:predicted AAA+ superfamily ATPase
VQEILESLMNDFHERPLPALVPRSAPFPRVTRKASVIAGMRRVGKTWFCYQSMQELLRRGIEKERLLYLNFEDDRLLPFAVRDFQSILDVYYRKFPRFKSQTCYFYLDELQHISGWDHFVRRVLDTEEVALCITGSSSKLLSTEIATSMRGRSMTAELFPLSFEEYLRFHGAPQTAPASAGSRARAFLEHHMDAYLKQGGFPEVQKVSEEERRQILRNYVDVVVLRDVIERHKVRNVTALRALTSLLLASPASRVSVNKIYNGFRSQGIASTKNDLYAFIDYLHEAYLFYPVPIHSRSEHIRRVNPSKMYAIDTGLLEAATLRRGEDRGAFLENLVFMHLRRTGIRPQYYVTRTGQEVDFIYQPQKQKPRLVQVCWSLRQAETRAREVSALQIAMKETRLSRGTIITWLDEKSPDPAIDVIPVWKWLLASASP